MCFRRIQGNHQIKSNYLRREFAEFLECEDILKMHYSDIDFEMPDGITDEEIQDILDRFENALDILNGLIRDKVITDEQIAKFDW